MMSLNAEILQPGSTELIGMSSMPPEVLERIFEFLAEEKLYLCGEVCNTWANLIKKMLPKIKWNPWFSNHQYGDVMLAFVYTRGSRFLRAEDINDIRININNLPRKERTSNPFINKTAIVKKQLQLEYDSLHEYLAEFLTEFGCHVHRLIYYYDVDTPQSIINLPLIFKSLNNLRSLTLYNPGGNLELAKKFGGVPETFAHLPHLSELEFLGFFDLGFLEHYGPQIQNLTINLKTMDTTSAWLDHYWHRLGRGIQNCSKLKRFKISMIDVGIANTSDIRYFKGLPIEHLAINSLKCKWNCKWISVSQIMSVIRFFWDSIKTLSFFGEIGNNKLCVCPNEPLGPPCQSIRVLNMLYSAAETEDFPLFLTGFPNLKHLTLFDREYTFQNRWLEKEELKKICEPLWMHVSPCVESISIRSRMFSNTSKNTFFPTLFTCNRAIN